MKMVVVDKTTKKNYDKENLATIYAEWDNSEGIPDSDR